jgi:hypothetical protein
MSKKTKIIVLPMLILAVIAVGFLLISSASIKTQKNNSSSIRFSDHYHLYNPPVSKSLTFAGEKVPMERYDVRESLDRELLVNAYWQSNILLYCKRAYRYFPLIESILKEEGVPEDFKYLALIESGLTNVVSPAKAAGFWQFMKETGIQHELEINDEIDERYHLEKATRAACLYLKRAYEKFGSWALAAAAYNMGENGVKRTIEEQKTTSYWDLLLNNETSRYVYRILAAKIILSNPQEYGIQLHLADLYQPLTVKTITVNTSIPDLISFANNHDMTYKQLKLLNPWLRSNKLTNKFGKSYTITLIDKKDALYENQIQSLNVEEMLSGL